MSDALLSVLSAIRRAKAWYSSSPVATHRLVQKSKIPAVPQHWQTTFQRPGVCRSGTPLAMMPREAPHPVEILRILRQAMQFVKGTGRTDRSVAVAEVVEISQVGCPVEQQRRVPGDGR